MIQGSDGNFYGTVGGGVFRFVPGGQFTVLTTFPPSNGDPTSADGPLVQASNGKLYGALSSYSQDQVQFYEIDTSGNRFQEFRRIGKLSVDFRIGNTIQASDGNLWTAFEQVSSSNGSVIGMSPANGAVVQSFSFEGANGSIPEAGVIQGSDGKIYGTTIGGGTLSDGKAPSGTVWSLDAGLPATEPDYRGVQPRQWRGGFHRAYMLAERPRARRASPCSSQAITSPPPDYCNPAAWKAASSAIGCRKVRSCASRRSTVPTRW